MSSSCRTWPRPTTGHGRVRLACPLSPSVGDRVADRVVAVTEADAVAVLGADPLRLAGVRPGEHTCSARRLDLRGGLPVQAVSVLGRKSVGLGRDGSVSLDNGGLGVRKKKNKMQ